MDAAPLSPQLAPPPPMPRRRVLLAYLNEARFELIGAMRTVTLGVTFLLLPLVIYLLIGVAISGESIAKNPALANFLFCSFAVFAVSGAPVFGIGFGIAMERDAGLMKLKRALPLPPGAYLLAKTLMATMISIAALLLLLASALLVGKLTLSAIQLVAITAVLIVGALPFCAIGLFIGAYSSGTAAPALANLVYLPMLWLGGLFFPLPKFLQAQRMIWPTFHLNQIATGIAGLEEFHVVPTLLSVGVLVGMTVLFGALALHRIARKG
jgi:ABC-2 type transport system permease protein